MHAVLGYTYILYTLYVHSRTPPQQRTPAQKGHVNHTHTTLVGNCPRVGVGVGVGVGDGVGVAAGVVSGPCVAVSVGQGQQNQ